MNYTSIDLHDVQTIHDSTRKMKEFFREYRTAVTEKKHLYIAYLRAKDAFDRYCDQARVVIKRDGVKQTVADVDGKLAAQKKYGELKDAMRVSEADSEEARDMLFAFVHGKELLLDINQNIRNKQFAEG